MLTHVIYAGEGLSRKEKYYRNEDVQKGENWVEELVLS